MSSSPHRSLSGQALEIYFRFTNCKLQMSPEAFRSKYGASNLQIARICRVAESTADRWFFTGPARTHPKPAQQFLLGLMDWLLSHAEQLPPEFWQHFCVPSGEPDDHPDSST